MKDGGHEDEGRARRGGRDAGLKAARPVSTIVGVALSVAAMLFVLWYAADVLLLVFAGVLLAVFLRSLSGWLSRRTPLSGAWSVAAVVAALAALLGLCFWLFAPSVAAQLDQLSEGLPRSAERVGRYLENYRWGRSLVSNVPSTDELLSGGGGVLSKATGVLSTTLGALTNVLIVLFVGLYLALEPGLYVGGVTRLLPRGWRGRAGEVLRELEVTLGRWLAGRLTLMAANGALTALGLWALGVPLALTLGLLAGLLNFIPNIGPVVAAVPALAVALAESPTKALYVLALYVLLQSLDGYVFTPLVQRRTVSLPPALTIIAQVLFGVLAGGLGVLLATPLTAAAVVLVKMLYVEDVLGDAVSLPGDGGGGESQSSTEDASEGP